MLLLLSAWISVDDVKLCLISEVVIGCILRN
jgi:hypothetical protein